MEQKLRWGLAALLAAGLAVSVVMLARQQMQYQENADSYEDAARVARFAPEARPVPSARTDPGPADTQPGDPVAEALGQIDLAALREVNGDVAGWLYLPGTELSYPVLYGDDNQYYLTHTWNRRSNSGGSIFLDYRCSPDFENFNTIIYGHRMGNDSMFGVLKYYENLNFWREHPTIYLMDGAGVRAYDIFAAWKAEVTSDAYKIDPGTEQGRQDFFDFCLGRNQLDTGITPGPDGRVLTLSTCTANGSRAVRWIVQAVEQEGGTA